MEHDHRRGKVRCIRANARDRCQQRRRSESGDGAVHCGVCGGHHGRAAGLRGTLSRWRCPLAGRQILSPTDNAQVSQRKPGSERLLRCTAGDALLNAGNIAAATGAALLCENAFARIDRGGGLPCPVRLPYFPDAAAAQLSEYSVLVVVDARKPVATFGYKCAHIRV